MKSKANIKGHPLHPILVTFPIAFFFGAFLADVCLVLTHKQFTGELARYSEAAGILSALLAAVPGIIDYYYTVPPESSAMKRATKHGLLNVTMLIVFSLTFYLRQDPEINIFLILSLEIIGLILLTMAGWLGGTLVIRNQIGVDHRYAAAGKWKEEYSETSSSGRLELSDLNTLKTDQMKLMHIGKKRIVIARTETEYVAFEDRCTHRGASLADGVMICGTVQCPWHGSQFSVKTGNVCAGPATKQIETYKIETVNNKHFLQL